MEKIVIVAVAENGTIGKNGSLPWHYPEDMAHFKELTTGNAVVMGRTTFEDIFSKLKGPLPDRLNIVLTRSGLEDEMKQDESVIEANSLSEAEKSAEERSHQKLFIAGGASVYKQFLPEADRIELTRIHEEYEGDTEFPEVDWSRWKEVNRDEREELSFISYVQSTE